MAKDVIRLTREEEARIAGVMPNVTATTKKVEQKNPACEHKNFLELQGNADYAHRECLDCGQFYETKRSAEERRRFLISGITLCDAAARIRDLSLYRC